MRAFIKFNKGLMNMPILVRLWLMLLMVVNLAIPFFYLNRLEAQVVVITFLASAMLMTMLTPRCRLALFQAIPAFEAVARSGSTWTFPSGANPPLRSGWPVRIWPPPP